MLVGAFLPKSVYTDPAFADADMSDSRSAESETAIFSVNTPELLALAVVIGVSVAEYAGVVSFESAVMVILVILTISHLVRPY